MGIGKGMFPGRDGVKPYELAELPLYVDTITSQPDHVSVEASVSIHIQCEASVSVKLQ